MIIILSTVEVIRMPFHTQTKLLMAINQQGGLSEVCMKCIYCRCVIYAFVSCMCVCSECIYVVYVGVKCWCVMCNVPLCVVDVGV